MATGEIIKDHRIMAVGTDRFKNVRAHIACAASHENFHAFTLDSWMNSTRPIETLQVGHPTYKIDKYTRDFLGGAKIHFARANGFSHQSLTFNSLPYTLSVPK